MADRALHNCFLNKSWLFLIRIILGNEDIVFSVNTGQDWYNYYKNHVEDLRDTKGSDYIKKNIPGAWLLLQVFDG